MAKIYSLIFQQARYLIFTLIVIPLISFSQNIDCDKLEGLINIQKEKKHSTHEVSKSDGKFNTVTTADTDTLLNTYILTTMIINEKVKTLETIFYFGKLYKREDYGEWRLALTKAETDSIRIKFGNMPSKNIMRYNCRELNSEFVNGEKYLVFISEIDKLNNVYEKKSNTYKDNKVQESNRLIIIEWYSEQGLLKKSERKTNNTLYAETTIFTTYEYDIDIPLIKEPIIKKN